MCLKYATLLFQMLQILMISCYQPNSSFVYNPIIQSGNFRASYIQNDGSNAYNICADLNSHLARVSVELANEEEAYSANFKFRHGQDVNIDIQFDTQQQQDAGLLTAQSNFKIQMLDMDAEIKQTLAYFSVQSYNADDCLKNINLYLFSNIITMKADQSGCNYNFTKFGKDISGLTDVELNNTVIATINCFEMSVTLPVGIYFSSLTPEDSFQIEFNCDQVKNSQQCLDIIHNLTFTPMTVSNFQLEYQLIHPQQDYLQVQGKFSNIVDPEFIDCYLESQYQISGDIVIFYFTPSGLCFFDSTKNQMIIDIADSKDLKIAKEWIFYGYDFAFNSSTVKFSLECNQIDIENCESLLNYLAEIEQLFVTITFVIYNDADESSFVIASPTRYQECFQHLEISTKYSNGDDFGQITIENFILDLLECNMVNPNRLLIQLQCYQKTIPNGMITDIEDAPFLVLSTRDIFSTINKTIVFDRLDNISMFVQMSLLIINSQIYCEVQYDNIIIPVTQYTDQTSIFDNLRIYLISVLGGILGGLLYAGIEVLIQLKCRHRNINNQSIVLPQQ